MTARLAGIAAFRLTSADPAGLARFYAAALGFTVGAPAAIPAAELALLGLAGRGTRVPLLLGAQRVDLDAFDPPGAPCPAAGIAANDPRFQHLAIVTSDAAAAWARAQAHGAVPISRGGPIRLPPQTGGVTAIKFRDPEGHPLELLQFPAGGSAWRGTGNLGIDHSAIVVADAATSRAFYEDLGLLPGRATLNHGPTQAALDALGGIEVDVQPLMPQREAPHLELLGYRTPQAARAVPLATNDIAATRTVWTADRDALLRDPDGHLHLLVR